MIHVKKMTLLWVLAIIVVLMGNASGCKSKVTPAAVYYTVTLKVTGAEGGTLKAMINKKPIETGSETNIPVLAGTKTTLMALPATGYRIGEWVNVAARAGTDTTELTVIKDIVVSVSFVKNE